MSKERKKVTHACGDWVNNFDSTEIPSSLHVTYVGILSDLHSQETFGRIFFYFKFEDVMSFHILFTHERRADLAKIKWWLGTV
jgi:hypothetical protein